MISVVIPTCRRPDLLGRCLDRLAPGMQTLAADRYEVIVTDDGEPTVEGLVADRYPWAVWNRGPRQGPAANRNAGAKRARGDWLAFTDDDCVPDVGWLAGFHSAVRDACQVYEGRTTCEAGIRSPLMHAPVNLEGGCFWSCNIMLATELFRALGGFDEHFRYAHMEDVEFHERVRNAGHSIKFVPAATVDHPPRRVPRGWALGRTHESGVYWWYRSGESRLVSPVLVYRTVRNRICTILRHRVSADTFLAVTSLGCEMASLLPRLPLWELKYRALADRKPSPSASSETEHSRRCGSED